MPRPKRKPSRKPKRDYSELRIIIPIAVFFAVLIGLGYWAAHRAARENPRQPLRVAGLPWLIESPAFAEVKKQFERREPDFVIEAATAEGPALLEKLTQDKPADLVVGLTREQVAGVAGGVMAWDDFFDARTARKDFLKTFLTDGTVGKRLVMMPVMGDGAFLLVRPQWLADAGVAAPFETWTQLAVAATKLTRGRGESTSRYGMAVDWGEGRAALAYVSALSARGAAAEKLTSPQSLDAVRFWSDLVSGGLCAKDTFASSPAARQAFVSGRAAMLWTVASAREQAVARLGAEHVTWLSLPGSEANGTAVVTYGAVVPAASQQQALAQRFVREHLLTEPFQRALAESAMRLPALRRNYENLKGGEWQMVLRVLQRGAVPRAHDFDRLDRVLVKDVTPAITGAARPADALAQAAKDLGASQGASP